jgi:hypothetical protein
MKSITFAQMSEIAILLKETFTVEKREEFEQVTLKKLSILSSSLSKKILFEVLDEDFSLKDNNYTVWINDPDHGEIELDVRTISIYHVTELMRHFLHQADIADGSFYRQLNIDYAYDLQLLRMPISKVELESHLNLATATKNSIKQHLYNCADFNNVLLRPDDFWQWYEKTFVTTLIFNIPFNLDNKKIIQEAVNNVFNIYPHDWYET